MTITVLSDIVMPCTLVAAGLSGRNARSNQRASNQAGFGSVNVQWSRPLREYDIGYIPMDLDLWQTIEGLWEVTKGGAYGFLMQDPKDPEVSIANGVLQPWLSDSSVGVAGFGYGIPAYRLYKQYPAYGGTSSDSRPITRPVLPLTALTRAGNPVAVGGGAGQVAISGSTVTFVADLTLAVSDVTVGATTDVELVDDIGIGVGGRLWLEAMTGSGATLLNDRSHVVTSVVGNTLTLATDTSGATINVSGNGKRFPQPSEALVWAGGFYVPVHFRDDELPWVLARGGPPELRLVSGQSIVLVEVRE